MKELEKIVMQILDEQNVAFIGSVSPEGFPEIKAMLPPRKREGLKTIYFTTNTSSKRVAHFRKNPKACVYTCNHFLFRGAMLQGTMEVLEDAASKELIWREGDTEYYPLGVTDPDYCVLRFTATSGRFYHDFQSENFTVS